MNSDLIDIDIDPYILVPTLYELNTRMRHEMTTAMPLHYTFSLTILLSQQPQ